MGEPIKGRRDEDTAVDVLPSRPPASQQEQQQPDDGEADGPETSSSNVHISRELNGSSHGSSNDEDPQDAVDPAGAGDTCLPSSIPPTPLSDAEEGPQPPEPKKGRSAAATDARPATVACLQRHLQQAPEKRVSALDGTTTSAASTGSGSKPKSDAAKRAAEFLKSGITKAKGEVVGRPIPSDTRPRLQAAPILAEDDMYLPLSNTSVSAEHTPVGRQTPVKSATGSATRTKVKRRKIIDSDDDDDQPDQCDRPAQASNASKTETKTVSVQRKRADAVLGRRRAKPIASAASVNDAATTSSKSVAVSAGHSRKQPQPDSDADDFASDSEFVRPKRGSGNDAGPPIKRRKKATAKRRSPRYDDSPASSRYSQASDLADFIALEGEEDDQAKPPASRPGNAIESPAARPLKVPEPDDRHKMATASSASKHDGEHDHGSSSDDRDDKGSNGAADAALLASPSPAADPKQPMSPSSPPTKRHFMPLGQYRSADRTNSVRRRPLFDMEERQNDPMTDNEDELYPIPRRRRSIITTQQHPPKRNSLTLRATTSPTECAMPDLSEPPTLTDKPLQSSARRDSPHTSYLLQSKRSSPSKKASHISSSTLPLRRHTPTRSMQPSGKRSKAVLDSGLGSLTRTNRRAPLASPRRLLTDLDTDEVSPAKLHDTSPAATSAGSSSRAAPYTSTTSGRRRRTRVQLFQLTESDEEALAKEERDQCGEARQSVTASIRHHRPQTHTARAKSNSTSPLKRVTGAHQEKERSRTPLVHNVNVPPPFSYAWMRSSSRLPARRVTSAVFEDLDNIEDTNNITEDKWHLCTADPDGRLWLFSRKGRGTFTSMRRHVPKRIVQTTHIEFQPTGVIVSLDAEGRSVIQPTEEQPSNTPPSLSYTAPDSGSRILGNDSREQSAPQLQSNKAGRSGRRKLKRIASSDSEASDGVGNFIEHDESSEDVVMLDGEDDVLITGRPSPKQSPQKALLERERMLWKTQDLRSSFKIVVQYLASSCLDPDFIDNCADDEDVYFLQPLARVQETLQSRRDLAVRSSAWSEKLRRGLDAYNKLQVAPMSRTVATCEACNRERSVGFELTLGGFQYKSDTYEAIGDDEGIVISKKHFNVGPTCAKRAKVYHQLAHFLFTVRDKCKKKLRKIIPLEKEGDHGSVLRRFLNQEEWFLARYHELQSLVDEADKYIVR